MKGCNLNHLNEVSILVTCFNKASSIETFAKQLESIRSYSPEIIIVDDFSHDGSREKLILLAETFSNTFLILNESNLGSAGSRNIAMKHATRDWLFFWDIDDQVNFSVMSDMVKQSITEDVQICKGRFSIAPSKTATREFLPEGISSVFNINDIAENVVDEMGYWRFIYSRKFLENNSIEFMPTFEDLKSRYFILDDVFFLILVVSSSARIAFSANQEPVYFYTPPIHDASSWRRFQIQSALFSKASLHLIEYVESKVICDPELIYELILRKAISHMRYLSLTLWFVSIKDFAELLFIKDNSYKFSFKINVISETLYSAVKNSIASVLHITST